jgi:hypothetical protein
LQLQEHATPEAKVLLNELTDLKTRLAAIEDNQNATSGAMSAAPTRSLREQGYVYGADRFVMDHSATLSDTFQMRLKRKANADRILRAIQEEFPSAAVKMNANKSIIQIVFWDSARNLNKMSEFLSNFNDGELILWPDAFPPSK